MPTSRRRFLGAAGASSVALLLPRRTAAENSADAKPVLPGGNPVLPGSGLCDPQIRVYGDRVYLYATHDASPDNKYYSMHDWWVWTSTDLIHWEHVSTLHPEETYWRKPSNECWATDGIGHNGSYYFYFSRGPKEIGVVVGDTPSGPWTDPLGKPLVADGQVKTEARDPGILQEEDGRTYIIFGLGDYFIAKLNDDMISFAETPRKVTIEHQSGPYGPGTGDDKPFLFKRNGIYYLSWGCYYAMSDNVYGPYVYKDTIIKKEHTAPEFQKGLTMDRHGSFFEFHGQWYFMCNDQSFPGQTPYFRTAVISYVHFRNNGEMATIELNRLGVGQYDAAAGRIEAEDFFSMIGGVVSEKADGGFEVAELRNGSELAYPNVANLPALSKMSFGISPRHLKGASIEIRDGGPRSRLLGTCVIPPRIGWGEYTTASCRLSNAGGIANIRLESKGAPGELLKLDWFSFS